MNRKARLHFYEKAYGEHFKVDCRVVGETPKRCRIAVDVPTVLPPGYTLLMPGMTKLVPKHAVEFLEEK